MNAKKAGGLVLAAMVAVAAMTGAGPGRAATKGRAAEVAAGNFRWSGECQIRCTDGRCQSYCATGIVFGFDAFDAKLKAEGELRARASSQGTVVEGTIRVTVNLFNLADRIDLASREVTGRGAPTARELASAEASAHRYTWTVWAHLLLRGDYGHHPYAIVANSDQEAMNQLSLHELAWGQQLQRQGTHYNSIESRFLSKQ